MLYPCAETVSKVDLLGLLVIYFRKPIPLKTFSKRQKEKEMALDQLEETSFHCQNDCDLWRLIE